MSSAHVVLGDTPTAPAGGSGSHGLFGEPVPAAAPCLRLTNAYSQRQGGDRKNDRIKLKERYFYLTNGKN
jgi:hypothetical protein